MIHSNLMYSGARERAKGWGYRRASFLYTRTLLQRSTSTAKSLQAISLHTHTHTHTHTQSERTGRGLRHKTAHQQPPLAFYPTFSSADINRRVAESAHVAAAAATAADSGTWPRKTISRYCDFAEVRAFSPGRREMDVLLVMRDFRARRISLVYVCVCVWDAGRGRYSFAAGVARSVFIGSGCCKVLLCFGGGVKMGMAGMRKTFRDGRKVYLYRCWRMEWKIKVILRWMRGNVFLTVVMMIGVIVKCGYRYNLEYAEILVC